MMIETDFKRLRKTVLLAACWIFASAAVCRAQPVKYRVGVLTPGGTFEPVFLGLKEGLSGQFHAQQREVKFAVEDSGGKVSNLVDPAKRILEARPDVLFTVTTPHALAAMRATAAVPIVFAWVGDPVRAGLVASYASSQNNLTGVASYSAPLSGKRLELLKEIAPATKRVLAVVAAKDVNAELSFDYLEAAAKKLRIEVVRRDARNKEDIERALADVSNHAVDAIFHVPSTLVGAYIDLLIQKSKMERIPLMVHEDAMVEKGALCAYGADFRLTGAQAAKIVAKILNGNKPSAIPVEIPDRFVFAVNLSTLKLIGHRIPQAVLARANRLVE